MTQPLNTALLFRFYFTKLGAPYNPSPAPTATLEKPDGTMLSPAPTLSNPQTGEFAFTLAANSVNLAGVYIATANTSDSAGDFYTSRASWEVGTNDVASIRGAFANGQIVVISPITSAPLAIATYYGNDYLATSGTSLDFTFSGMPSISGATVTMRAQSRYGKLVSLPMTVLSSSSARLEITAAQWASFPDIAGPGTYPFDFDIQAVLADGEVKTLASGVWTVTRVP